MFEIARTIKMSYYMNSMYIFLFLLIIICAGILNCGLTKEEKSFFSIASSNNKYIWDLGIHT